MAKMCKLCDCEVATVPDRDKPGRMVKAVCRTCHRKRIERDLAVVLRTRRDAK